MPPILHPPAACDGSSRSHRFVAPDPQGWHSVALIEWELTAQEWVDRHPHDEFNYVLEGTLVVECDGVTVEAPQGSVVHVPAGSTGHYRPPTTPGCWRSTAPTPTAPPPRSAASALWSSPGAGTPARRR
ncbi:cupin domain-containing protein [Pseudonocardia halophobica]|uniref:cupin domain-containing protein n=1 Tax=Pseudonocardia halophobica TaxID=29401 RepID=UPI003D8BD6F0